MSYEFNDEDGKTIYSVGVKALTVGIMLTIAGVFELMTAFLNTSDFGTLKSIILGLEAILVIIIGIFLIMPSDNFRNIDQTEGNDINELMTGLKELSTGFKIILVMLIGLILLDIGLLISGA